MFYLTVLIQIVNVLLFKNFTKSIYFFRIYSTDKYKILIFSTLKKQDNFVFFYKYDKYHFIRSRYLINLYHKYILIYVKIIEKKK